MIDQNTGPPAVISRKVALAAVLVLPFALALAFFLVTRTAQMDGDSPCYIQWCAKRTSVYPLFVSIFHGPVLLAVQLSLFAGAVAFMAWTAFRSFGSVLLSALLTLGILLNPYVWQLQGSIMSEALTTPLLIVLLTCLLLCLAHDRPWAVAAGALVAGLCAATRPSLLPIVLIPLASVWLTATRSRLENAKLPLLCVLIWATPITADKIYSRAVLGDRMTSLAGRHMFAKAVVIDAPPLDRAHLAPLDRKLADLMENGFEPARASIRPLRGNVRQIVRLNYEVCFQYACTDSVTERLGVPRPALDDALFRVGAARLEQNPAAYLALTWDEYRGMWLLHPRKVPALAREYNDYLRSARPLPFQQYLGEEARVVPDREQHNIYRFNRAVLIAMGLVLALLALVLIILLPLVRREPLLIGSLASAIGVEAVLVFSSFFGVGIPRYALGLWPAIVSAFALAAYYLFDVVLRGRRPANRRASL